MPYRRVCCSCTEPGLATIQGLLRDRRSPWQAFAKARFVFAVAQSLPPPLWRCARPPAQATVEYRVGTRIPSNARLYAVPQDLAVEVPAVHSYKYMTVNSRVLLVDLATSEVVAEVAE